MYGPSSVPNLRPITRPCHVGRAAVFRLKISCVIYVHISTYLPRYSIVQWQSGRCCFSACDSASKHIEDAIAVQVVLAAVRYYPWRERGGRRRGWRLLGLGRRFDQDTRTHTDVPSAMVVDSLKQYNPSLSYIFKLTLESLQP